MQVGGPIPGEGRRKEGAGRDAAQPSLKEINLIESIRCDDSHMSIGLRKRASRDTMSDQHPERSGATLPPLTLCPPTGSPPNIKPPPARPLGAPRPLSTAGTSSR